MNKKAARNLWSRISEQLPDFRLKNRLLVRIPLRSVLCGVLFEPSAFSNAPFYINFFAQPLYVPEEHLVLTFGSRVPGQWDYDLSKIEELAGRVLQAIRTQAVPFFQLFDTPELFYQNIAKKISPKNIHLHRYLVFTALHVGKSAEAHKHLETLKQLVWKADPKIPWPKAVLEETQLMLNEAAKDSFMARDHLRQIELGTIRNLKLEDLPFVSDLPNK